ncbi:glycosyltransferase [Allorhizobium pseudoryzae]|uniref:glycosyltransferase n=1 Tax=Allorhizobium pseudoryzae TaxID=379684 RepID=UPI003D026B49
MTHTQWLEWIAQPENRFGLRLHDPEAQKKFLVEWYFRAIERNKEILLSDRAIAILSEVRTFVPGLRIPRFLHHIYNNRQDLQEAFPPIDPATPARLSDWYRQFGCREFPSRIAERLGGMVEVGANDLTSGEDWSERRPDWRRRKCFGVNLVGYAQGEFGLGEDIRTLARCMEIAGVDYCVVNLSGGSNARQDDRTLESKFSTDPPFPVSILCVSAFDIPHIHRNYHDKIFDDRYVIAYSPWEIETFPREWWPVWSLVDEVWAISRHVFDAYRPTTDKPCFHMPLAVDVRPARAAAQDSPKSRFRFVCSYDPNSHATRKNPLAVIAAFLKAFPNGDEKCSLLFMINGHNHEDRISREIPYFARFDSRIEYHVGTQDRKTYLSQLEAADCFISAHRAEGFGRNIAEAKALGTQVLATAYSGSVDFIDSDEGVAWKYVTIRDHEYPYSEGARWADIDVSDLAVKMRSRYEDRNAGRVVRLPEAFSPASAAERYLQRLRTILESLADP